MQTILTVGGSETIRQAELEPGNDHALTFPRVGFRHYSSLYPHRPRVHRYGAIALPHCRIGAGLTKNAPRASKTTRFSCIHTN